MLLYFQLCVVLWKWNGKHQSYVCDVLVPLNNLWIHQESSLHYIECQIYFFNVSHFLWNDDEKFVTEIMVLKGGKNKKALIITFILILDHSVWEFPPAHTHTYTCTKKPSIWQFNNSVVRYNTRYRMYLHVVYVLDMNDSEIKWTTIIIPNNNVNLCTHTEIYYRKVITIIINQTILIQFFLLYFLLSFEVHLYFYCVYVDMCECVWVKLYFLKASFVNNKPEKLNSISIFSRVFWFIISFLELFCSVQQHFRLLFMFLCTMIVAIGIFNPWHI